jgi:Ala-tRNA(Pro) deacylase
MSGLKPWINYLEDSGIRYSHSIHPPADTALATADAERVPAAEFAKCVVFHNSQGYGMAVVPADEYVDLDKLSGILGTPGVRLATERELAQLFPDCELGAMPPFGNIYHMPVIVEFDVALNEFIAFTVGTHRDAIRMGFDDYRRLVKPVVAHIAAQEELLL